MIYVLAVFLVMVQLPGTMQFYASGLTSRTSSRTFDRDICMKNGPSKPKGPTSIGDARREQMKGSGSRPKSLNDAGSGGGGGSRCQS